MSDPLEKEFPTSDTWDEAQITTELSTHLRTALADVERLEAERDRLREALLKIRNYTSEAELDRNMAQGEIIGHVWSVAHEALAEDE